MILQKIFNDPIIYRGLTVKQADELHTHLMALDADSLGDVADLIRALALDGADTKIIMADAYRLANMRSIAKRNGILISKGHNCIMDEPGYMLVDSVCGAVIDGARPCPYWLSLDDIEGWVQVWQEAEASDGADDPVGALDAKTESYSTQSSAIDSDVLQRV